MDKLKMQSLDVIGSNIKKIQQLFPNCVTERLGKDGKPELAIDFDKLKAELSNEIIGEGEERYQFTWPDKRVANRLANTPTTMTLRPCRKESVDFDHTQNLYIEGDNLDVLKVLRETYLGKVKMIYIDPPYNTGNDFVYNDDFAQGIKEFEQKSGLFDEEGNQTIDHMLRNTENNGRFHTDWLNMIYPRLKVARDLLSDDGVIFISIDENEIANLIKLGCEIFGESNHIGEVVVKSNPRGSMSISEIASLHEYLVIFSKNRLECKIPGHFLTEDMTSEYKYTDERGAYRLLGLRMRGGFWRRSDRPKLYFPIYVNSNGKISLKKDEYYCEEVLPIQPSTMEDGTWRWSEEKVKSNSQLLIGKLINRNGEFFWDIYQKDYLNNDNKERRTKAKSIWYESEINYQNGTIEIKNLFNKGGIFDYSKPTFLLCRIIEMLDLKDSDIVLDFFSGSATTAHAVMQLNAEDGGNRKFIMVQIPEKTDEKSEAFKAGYKNICEIGEERIRRAGKKIKEDNKDKEGIEKLDTGFRVLKLDSSNMNDVYYTPEEFDLNTLFSENVKSDRTAEDLLFQVMLDLGIELSAKIEKQLIAGKEVFLVDQNYLIACFDEDVNETTITEIAKMKPVYFVMRDASAANDNVIDNFEQLFEAYSKDTVRKIL